MENFPAGTKLKEDQESHASVFSKKKIIQDYWLLGTLSAPIFFFLLSSTGEHTRGPRLPELVCFYCVSVVFLEGPVFVGEFAHCRSILFVP